MRLARNPDAGEFALDGCSQRWNRGESRALDNTKHAGSHRLFLLSKVPVDDKQDPNFTLGSGDNVRRVVHVDPVPQRGKFLKIGGTDFIKAGCRTTLHTSSLLRLETKRITSN